MIRGQVDNFWPCKKCHKLHRTGDHVKYNVSACTLTAWLLIHWCIAWINIPATCYCCKQAVSVYTHEVAKS